MAPLFLLLTFGIIIFGTIVSTYHSIEQLAAEASRASLGESTDAERDQIARAFLVSVLPSYPCISAANLTIATASVLVPHSFKVSLTYDMSSMFVFSLGGIVQLPKPGSRDRRLSW